MSNQEEKKCLDCGIYWTPEGEYSMHWCKPSEAKQEPLMMGECDCKRYPTRHIEDIGCSTVKTEPKESMTNIKTPEEIAKEESYPYLAICPKCEKIYEFKHIEKRFDSYWCDCTEPPTEVKVVTK